MPEEVEVTVLRNGGKDRILVPTESERWIAALLDDRAKYIVAGHLHLIPGIDETLAHYGYEGPLPEYETETKPNKKGQ
jgi:hypothetical protein